ncbi:maleylpyruvate isomerase family mycothiol-dependent enzyme [uncultured Phycicoccus sp.]|uniref:maleylpyruvate isomerase family mycothiol-dependent enzyme n=1 Tax=uncultured Phycicoccus sp. TaxID=661422 RepID=UPI002606C534|nr:maleylpyruvate isomerase family mycothiol-dependent enzyme [uncultured Phycicoccus sp.]
MTTTQVDIVTVPRITRGPEADRLAAAAYDRLIALLESLPDDAWGRPTDCAAWTVHAMVAHLVGAARGHASRVEFVRQVVHGQRAKGAFDGNDMDAMNAYQVERNEHLTPAELIAELRALAPRAVRGRARTPGLLRRRRIPMAPSGSVASGTPASIGLGELMDVILTRDVWLHRIDICRAVGRRPDLDQDVDGRIVADIVADWAARHGRPVDLELTGPAGGRFVQGDRGEHLVLDAVEFCRILSGRAGGEGLLRTKVVF